jgi:hypothetical protein
MLIIQQIMINNNVHPRFMAAENTFLSGIFLATVIVIVTHRMKTAREIIIIGMLSTSSINIRIIPHIFIVPLPATVLIVADHAAFVTAELLTAFIRMTSNFTITVKVTNITDSVLQHSNTITVQTMYNIIGMI